MAQEIQSLRSAEGSLWRVVVQSLGRIWRHFRYMSSTEWTLELVAGVLATIAGKMCCRNHRGAFTGMIVRPFDPLSIFLDH
jgi:hypothetical protein